MATKRRTDYQVDEEALKRMMAGDVTALDKMASPAEAPETKSRPAPSQEKQEKNFAGSPKQQIRKSTDEASGPDEYRQRFLKERLSGSRRQTYIHDAFVQDCCQIIACHCTGYVSSHVFRQCPVGPPGKISGCYQ